MNRQEREGFDRAATASAQVAARVLHGQFAPKAPTFTAIAELAQGFHNSARRGWKRSESPTSRHISNKPWRTVRGAS